MTLAPRSTTASWIGLLSLAAAVLIGCGEGLVGDEDWGDAADDEEMSRSMSSVDAQPPLVLYYGTIDREELNYELIVPGLDVVFTGHGAGKLTSGAGDHVTGKAESGLFKALHDRGARIAYTMSLFELVACLYRTTWTNADKTESQPDICPDVGKDGVEDTALFIEGKLKDGYDYMNFDEVRGPALKGHPAFDFGDNRVNSAGAPVGAGARLRSLIRKLAAMGHDRKMTLWFSPGTTDVASQVPADPKNDSLYRFRGLFKTCINHCRKMIFETYAIKTSTVVDHDYQRYHESLAARLHRIQDGTNKVSMAGVGIGNSDGVHLLDRPQCDIAPFKGSCSGRGGLEDQFKTMLNSGSATRYWRGVGFWSLGRVLATSVWDREDFAHYLKSRTAWWIAK
jgi:hypothetical protein